VTFKVIIAIYSYIFAPNLWFVMDLYFSIFSFLQMVWHCSTIVNAMTTIL